jgi:hypothetical protein
VVEDVDTIDRVREAFEDLKRGALAASVHIGCGIRIKDDLAVVEGLEPLPSAPHQPFAYRQGRSLARIVVTEGKPQFQSARILPHLIQGLEFGVTSTSAMDALSNLRVKLACTLYVDSFFEVSSEARFVALCVQKAGG